jgi:acyl carrier protein
MNSLMTRFRALSTLARPAAYRFATRPVFMTNAAPFRYFSTQQQLNENEVIELVEGKIFEVLKSAAKCNHSKLARTASFEELGFDSLDGVELVLAMEEHFGFDLSNQDAEKINTVMDAIQIFHSYYTKRMQPATQGGQQ